MGKIFSSLFLFLIFFLSFSVPYTSASLITVRKDGKIVWNVLSEKTYERTRSSSLEVKKVGEEFREAAFISLEKKGSKVNLVVSSENSLRELDIEESPSLVEIEERPEIQEIVFGVRDGRFSLEQNGVVGLTDYPIQIDVKKSSISILTSKGGEFLKILPREAVDFALRTRLISKANKEVEIFEINDTLQYKIEGERVFNFLDLFKYSIPVTVFISATNGELLSIDSPTWYKYLKFLFV